MLKKIFSISTLLSSVILSSCATTYISPTKGPTAQIAVTKPQDVHVSIYNDPIECKWLHPSQLDYLSPLNKKGWYKYVTIPANEPVTIGVTVESSVYQGYFSTITFTPEPGKKYVVEDQIIKRTPSKIFSTIRISKVVEIYEGKKIYISIPYLKRKTDEFTGKCTDQKLKEKLKRE